MPSQMILAAARALAEATAREIFETFVRENPGETRDIVVAGLGLAAITVLGLSLVLTKRKAEICVEMKDWDEWCVSAGFD